MVLSYVTCKNILMCTSKMITLSQDLYWNGYWGFFLCVCVCVCVWGGGS
jgi:hypothetical protein